MSLLSIKKMRVSGLKQALVIGILQFTAHSALAQSTPSILEAEAMSDKGSARVESPGILSFIGNTTASQQISIDSAGDYKISILAKGLVVAGVAPLITLQFDGVKVGQVFVDTATLAPYAFSAKLSKGTHKLSVSFVNDYYGGPGKDRNVYLDQIVITQLGAVVTPPAPLPVPIPVPAPVPTPTPTPPTVPVPPVNTACTTINSGSFFGCYYDNKDFTALKSTRTDSQINFDFGTLSPFASMQSDTFSIVWRGRFNFEKGTYNFSTTADDGIRISIDGVVLIDQFKDQAPSTYTASKLMTAGEHVIEVKYYENLGGAVVKFSYALAAVAPTPVIPPPATIPPVSQPPVVTPVPTDSVSVKSFGVRGDGVTDDTTALQQVASKAGGKSIYFPPGVYIISRPVVWTSLYNQTIYGDGATLKIQNWQNGNANWGALTLKSPINVTVRNLSFVGYTNLSYIWGASRMDGLNIQSGRNIKLANLDIRNLHTYGINGDNNDGFEIRNNKVNYVHGFAIACGRCTNVVVANNEASSTSDPKSVGGNDTGGIPIFFQHGSNYVIENNNIHNGWDTATKTEGTSNVVYRGNTVDTFGKDGIKIMFVPALQGGTGQTVSNGVVENNTIRNYMGWKFDGTGGILMQGVSGGRVQNNILYGVAGRKAKGITLSSYSSGAPQDTNMTVLNNTVIDYQVGILVETLDAALVQGNKLISSGSARNMSHCIDIGAGPGTIVQDNTFSGWNSICVLGYGSSRDILVQRNSFQNGDVGVYLDGNVQRGFHLLNNLFNAPINRAFNFTGAVTCSGNSGTNVQDSCK